MSVNNCEEIQQRLSLLIGKRWKNVSAMARQLEVSDSFLRQILRGKTGVSATVLKKLASNGVDVNWVLTGQASSKGMIRDQFEGVWSELSESEREQILKVIASLKSPSSSVRASL